MPDVCSQEAADWQKSITTKTINENIEFECNRTGGEGKTIAIQADKLVTDERHSLKQPKFTWLIPCNKVCLKYSQFSLFTVQPTIQGRLIYHIVAEEKSYIWQCTFCTQNLNQQNLCYFLFKVSMLTSDLSKIIHIFDYKIHSGTGLGYYKLIVTHYCQSVDLKPEKQHIGSLSYSRPMEGYEILLTKWRVPLFLFRYEYVIK